MSSLLPQLEALLSGESDEIANMANIAATLKKHLFLLGDSIVL